LHLSLTKNQPIGAYFSDITGSIARNSIRDSYQRCIVLTDVKGITVSDNIAHNTVGHCFALATGSETNNNFVRNLGAATLNAPIGKLMSITDTDTNAATFYAANPANTWTGNTAAGSESNGMWFELLDSVRGVASKYYPLISPSTASIGSFSGNVFHSNGVDGLRFYPNGWYPSTAATLTGVKSFRNWRDGIYFQSTGSVTVDGGSFADNLMGIEVDKDCENITVTNAAISGYSDLYKSQVAQGGLASHCPAYMPLIGVQLQSYLYSRDSVGFTLSNIQFSNFDDSTGCIGSRAIDVDPDPRDDHFSAYSKLEKLSYDASVNASRVNLCGIVASGVNDVMIRDNDGSNDPSGNKNPGFIVNSGFAATPFLASAGCVDITQACAKYCPNVCLRALDVAISPDSQWEGVNLFVSSNDGVTVVFPTYFEAKTTLVNNTLVPDLSMNAFYLRRRFATAILLPGRQYTMTFKSPTGDVVWPTFVEPFWRTPNNCSPFANESSVTFVKPATATGYCSSLLLNGDAESGGPTGYSGWLETGGIISSTTPGLGGSTAILLSGRQNTFNGPAQFLDSRCFVSGNSYEITLKYKLVYASGGALFQCNPSITDSTLGGVCPRGTLQIRKINGQSVNVTYLYPVASPLATSTPSSGFGFLYGYFTFDNDMAAADSILFVVERANRLFNIIVDDVQVTQSTQLCASPIINGNLELGDNRGWYAFGNTSLDIVSPGADGSNYALRAQGRSQFWSSPAQNVMTDCIVEGDKFAIGAKIKLEKGGKPYVCDPTAVWGKVFNGTCPKLSFRISKAGVNTTVEDIGSLTGTWNSSGWNAINGAGTWSNAHKTADTLMLYVSKLEADVVIYLDQIIFGSSDNWTCTGPGGIVRNYNVEAGDARYWTTFGGSTVQTVVGGAKNTKTAVAASNRQVAKSGVGQFLDTTCVDLGQVYQVSAMVKLLNSTGGPIDCLPEATYGPNTCPLASIMSQSLGGVQTLHPVASVYNGTWLAGGQWNELRGYFTFFSTEKDAQTKMIVFERAGPGLTLVVDEVSIKPVSLGGGISSSPQV
jgi:hypothetical protein